MLAVCSSEIKTVFHVSTIKLNDVCNRLLLEVFLHCASLRSFVEQKEIGHLFFLCMIYFSEGCMSSHVGFVMLVAPVASHCNTIAVLLTSYIIVGSKLT